MKKRSSLLAGLLLGLAVACGGSHTSTPPPAPPAVPAQGLVYTDPTGTGWRLVKDGSSTATRVGTRCPRCCCKGSVITVPTGDS